MKEAPLFGKTEQTKPKFGMEKIYFSRVYFEALDFLSCARRFILGEKGEECGEANLQESERAEAATYRGQI